MDGLTAEILYSSRLYNQTFMKFSAFFSRS